MESRAANLIAAVGVGIALTAAMEFAAYFVYDLGAEDLARTLTWANTLLQRAVPCNNIGTTAEPFCEGTPLNLLAYFASFPVSLAAYSVVAYGLVLRRVRFSLRDAPSKSAPAKRSTAAGYDETAR